MSPVKRFGYWAGLVIGAVYLLNPTAGIFEIVPDNVPLLGNLDETAAVALVLACWRGLRRGKQRTTQADP